MELTRANIVIETREWIGTPYHHLASLKGVGCDCVGLVIGVWKSLGQSLKSKVPVYSPQWHLHQKESQLIDILENTYHLERLPTTSPPLGSILCLGLEKGPSHHVGIMVSETTFAHSYISSKKVVEVTLDEKWKRRLRAIYDLPGVVD